MEQNIFSPTFIIGVPRSGTSLLRVILDSHSEIAGAPETSWLTGGYTDFSLRKLVDELINNKIGATKNLEGITPNVVNIAAKNFLSTIFNEYLLKRKKSYLVLKTPDDAAHLDFLLDLFPASKYIHIFRDGRDVACSTVKQKNNFFGETLTNYGDLNLFNALKRWQEWEENIRLHLKDQESISISYEQLVQNPSTVIQQILSFLDIKYEKEMIEYSMHEHEYPEWEAGSHDVKSMGDILQSRIGRWENEISPELWAQIDRIYGSFLVKLGYKKCEEIKKGKTPSSQDTTSDIYKEWMEFCTNEIITLKKVIHDNNIQLFAKQKEISKKNKEIIQKNGYITNDQKQLENQKQQIENLNQEVENLKTKIHNTFPNLQSQIKQKSITINRLQNTLQSREELITRIIKGKSFKLGRLITAPSRIIRNSPPVDKEIQLLLQKKEHFVNLGDQLNAGFGNHRSGWSYAITSLAPINRPDSIYLDTFIERTFVWKPGEITPTLKPWIGFIHVPPNVPDWFQSEQSNDAIFKTKAWQESLPFCKGLFTLSDYHKKSLEKILNVPINSLLHPTEFPANKWQFEKFVLNSKRKIVQIGWWLRKLHAIFELPSSNYEKVFIRVSNDPYFQKIFQKEFITRKKSGQFNSSMYETATIIEFLPNEEYDRILSENIVFVDLYDSSANNLVIECIARNTPLLINPLEPVIEYLGENYPFYYTSYEEAVEKAQNINLVEETHNYLKNHQIKHKLTGEYFLQSFINSEIVTNCQ